MVGLQDSGRSQREHLPVKRWSSQTEAAFWSRTLIQCQHSAQSQRHLPTGEVHEWEWNSAIMWTKWPDFYVTDLYIIILSLKPGVVWRIKYFSFSCCMEELYDTLRSCDCSLSAVVNMTLHVCNYLTYRTVIFQWYSNDVLITCWSLSLTGCYGCSRSGTEERRKTNWASSGSLCGNGHHHHHHVVTWLHSCVQHHGIAVESVLHSAVVLLCNVQWHRARWEQWFKHFSDSLRERSIVCFTDTDPVHWFILKFLRTS